MFTIPGVDDFKGQFARDFPFAITAFGAAAAAVLTGGIVSSFNVTNGGTGYSSAPSVVLTAQPGDTGSGATATATIANGSVTGLTVANPGSGYLLPPIVSFSGGAGDDTNLQRVRDEDIEGAILDAQFNINPGLFPNQQFFSRAFLYLAAHQLIEKLKMAAAGVQSQYAWLTASKGVDGVSQSFKIPDVVANNPTLANYSTTRYGAMYLQIVMPLLVGNVQGFCTFTNP